MSDNLANIRNYQIQLQQVETALLTDPGNEELQTLLTDLQEVISLTMAMMDTEELDKLQKSKRTQSAPMSHNFKAGDYVLAPLSEDGQFYEAQIEDITSDGQCTVVFTSMKKRPAEVCLVELLKPLSGKNRRPYSSTSSTSNLNDATGSSIKDFKAAQEAREALKRKQTKRKDKLKTLEEEREKDKMKWQSFASKVTHKKMKGTSKKSIFATPESVTGRVGVGTCGVGGKPMTEYQLKMEKVKKTVTSLPKLNANGEEVFETRPSASTSGSRGFSGRNRFD